MRMLFKFEISSWSIFNVGGKGFLGDFWLPPLIVLFALFLIYLEGRGKIRPLYHALLLFWHFLITAVVVYGTLKSDSVITFGTWGISLSFIWLVVPFVLFLIAAIILVIKENTHKQFIPAFKWNIINRKPLILAIILFPIAIVFFQLGTEFNWQVKIAVGSTIVQWIFLTDALGRPYKKK
jgi:hypothetical protein